MSTDAVIVICDRCGATVAGIRCVFEVGKGAAPVVLTSGFYELASEIVCEPCRWAEEDSPYTPQDPDERAAVQARREREAKRVAKEMERIEAARQREREKPRNDA